MKKSSCGGNGANVSSLRGQRHYCSCCNYKFGLGTVMNYYDSYGQRSLSSVWTHFNHNSRINILFVTKCDTKLIKHICNEPMFQNSKQCLAQVFWLCCSELQMIIATSCDPIIWHIVIDWVSLAPWMETIISLTWKGMGNSYPPVIFFYLVFKPLGANSNLLIFDLSIIHPADQHTKCLTGMLWCFSRSARNLTRIAS